MANMIWRADYYHAGSDKLSYIGSIQDWNKNVQVIFFDPEPSKPQAQTGYISINNTTSPRHTSNINIALQLHWTEVRLTIN